MNIDERLDKITATLEQHERNFNIIGEQFKQIGENFRQTNQNFQAMKERMDQQTDAIDKLLAATTRLQAIAEVHDYRIQKLERSAPTAQIPKRKTGRG